MPAGIVSNVQTRWPGRNRDEKYPYRHSNYLLTEGHGLNFPMLFYCFRVQ